MIMRISYDCFSNPHEPIVMLDWITGTWEMYLGDVQICNPHWLTLYLRGQELLQREHILQLQHPQLRGYNGKGWR